MAFDVHFESGILSVKTVRDFYLALKHTNPRVQIKMGPDTRRSRIFWVESEFFGLRLDFFSTSTLILIVYCQQIPKYEYLLFDDL